MRPIWVLALLLTHSVAWACRCEPLTLGQYYAQADSVQIGRLLSSHDAGNDRLLEFGDLTAFKPVGRPIPKTRSFRTGGSSASCGLRIVPGATYVLFAQSQSDDPTRSQVNSCNGSRVIFTADGEPGTDFIDVPLRYLPSQLLAHAGRDELDATPWPNAQNPLSTQFIGLLDLKTIAHGGPVTIYEEPTSASTTIETINDWTEVEFRESGYEVPAARVFANINGWYRVRLTHGTYGWVPPDAAGTYFAYAELAPRRLNYLNQNWSGLIWPEPGAGIPFQHRRKPEHVERGEHPARVLEARYVAESLWFRVSLLDRSPCSGKSQKETSSGWVPAYGLSGEPTVWFYSRGC